jgi:hypothetical protein
MYESGQFAFLSLNVYHDVTDQEFPIREQSLHNIELTFGTKCNQYKKSKVSPSVWNSIRTFKCINDSRKASSFSMKPS